MPNSTNYPVIPFDVSLFVPARGTFLIKNGTEDNSLDDDDLDPRKNEKKKLILLNPALKEGPTKEVVAIGEYIEGIEAGDTVIVNAQYILAGLVFKGDDGKKRLYYLFPDNALIGKIRKDDRAERDAKAEAVKEEIEAIKEKSKLHKDRD
jgi:hypothetical protein